VPGVPSGEVLVLVNPAAGGGHVARVWPGLRAALRRHFPDAEEHWTTRPGEATDIARQAAARGVRRLLAVGGDGTLHAVVNGLAGSSVAVAPLPLGTGNDFARAAGLWRPIPELLAALADGAPRPVDLGSVHGRYFLNVAGVGFDARVAEIVNAMAQKPRGTLPYLLTAVRTAWTYLPPVLTLAFDDGPPAGPARQLLVAVANSPGYGGGMRICPPARIDDGVFHVLTVGDLRRWAILRLLPRVFSGRHLADPRIAARPAVRLTIEGPSEVAVHADGEVVGGLPARFAVHPGHLLLWAPRASAPSARGAD